jgi:NADH-quinone oxidoreductase subunit M
MKLPVLSLLIMLPAVAALLLWLLPPRFARRVAMLSMLASLALAVAALIAYDPSGARFQLVEQKSWMPSVNVHYLVGVDGLSILFLPATALLFLGSLVACWNRIQEAPRFHFSLLLLLQAVTLGIFCALDTVLFFVFWEMSLIPLYFLLARWGVTEGATAAATRYFMIMLAGGIPLLMAFIMLAASQAVPSFDMRALLVTPLPKGTQVAVFLLCLIGFGVR